MSVELGEIQERDASWKEAEDFIAKCGVELKNLEISGWSVKIDESRPDLIILREGNTAYPSRRIYLFNVESKIDAEFGWNDENFQLGSESLLADPLLRDVRRIFVWRKGMEFEGTNENEKGEVYRFVTIAPDGEITDERRISPKPPK